MTNQPPNLMDEVNTTTVPPGHIALWWIGQAGYIIKTPQGRVLIIDAYLSGGNTRMTHPPLKPEDIRCDLYLTTHNHLDHTDHETIEKIPEGNIETFVGPRNVAASLKQRGIEEKRIQEVNVGEEKRIKGIRIKGTFCIPTDETVLDSEGFLLTTEDGITIYHTGDTGYHDFLYYLSNYSIDVMLTIINGGMGNMGIDEAVKLTRLLRPKLVIPNHYDMFESNTADPKQFKTRLQATGADPACQILRVGEKYIYPPGST